MSPDLNPLACRSRGALVAAACLLVAAAGAAQDRAPGVAAEGAGNPVARVLFENYSPPRIRSIDTRGDAALEAMVREGRLRLTEIDVVRLALENNVDINVERYSPYF